MDKKLFDELLESVKEMDQIAKGKKKPARSVTIKEPQVQRIRERTGLSRAKFTRLIGVSKRTLENWEQGRRRPDWSRARVAEARRERPRARNPHPARVDARS